MVCEMECKNKKRNKTEKWKINQSVDESSLEFIKVSLSELSSMEKNCGQPEQNEDMEFSVLVDAARI